MKKRLVYFCLLLYTTASHAQRVELHASGGWGAQYFLNKTDGSFKPGLIRQSGLELFFPNHNRAMAFRLGFMFTVNNYQARLKLFDATLRVRQSLLWLHPETLLQLRKKLFLKAGIMAGTVVNDWLEVVQTTNTGYYAFSRNTLFAGYHSTKFQAAVSGGVCIPFNVKQGEFKFDVTAMHYATGLVESDYTNPGFMGTNGPPILSTKLRSTTLVASLSVALKRTPRDKRKTEDEEE